MTQAIALVLGATGSIGGEVARQLAARGWKVRALHRNAATLQERDDRFEWLKGDAMIREDVIAAADGGTVPAREHIKTVWIIVMENQNWSSIKGSKSAPYINDTLLPMASHAEQYFNPLNIHPSLPNYIWMEAGTNFGIADDRSPLGNSQSTTQHLVTLLKNAPQGAIEWRAYQENISGSDCPLSDKYPYVV